MPQLPQEEAQRDPDGPEPWPALQGQRRRQQAAVEGWEGAAQVAGANLLLGPSSGEGVTASFKTGASFVFCRMGVSLHFAFYPVLSFLFLPPFFFNLIYSADIG